MTMRGADYGMGSTASLSILFQEPYTGCNILKTSIKYKNNYTAKDLLGKHLNENDHKGISLSSLALF